MQMVRNFPVLNEGNLIGLLKKFRMDLQKSREFAGKQFGDKNDELAMKFLDFEQRVVEDNLKKIKNFETENSMAERLGALKEKYN